MIAPTEVLEGIIVPSTEETGALVVLGEGREPLDLFLDPTVREALLETVRVQVRAIPTDASTIKGRKAIASLAYRIAQTKTAIDDVGKTLVAELKDRPKKVDAGRAVIREGLQALQDETRASLDAWEAEEAKRIAETVALEEAAALARKIEDDHEFALLLDDKMTREAEDRRREAQEAQDRRDAQVRADAQAAADRAAQEALDAAARREQESKDREAQAIADRTPPRPAASRNRRTPNFVRPPRSRPNASAGRRPPPTRRRGSRPRRPRPGPTSRTGERRTSRPSRTS